MGRFDEKAIAGRYTVNVQETQERNRKVRNLVEKLLPVSYEHNSEDETDDEWTDMPCYFDQGLPQFHPTPLTLDGTR